MPFTIIRQDITKMKVDAIVNAANTALAMGGGVCGAIFQAADPAKMQAACAPLAPINSGQAVITPGFELPCRYVIHAAGPVYDPSDTAESERLLRSAYTKSLQLAAENGCESIAFPLISSGIYGYPKSAALQTATEAIQDFLIDHELDIYLAVFDRAAFSASEALFGEVKSYVDAHYVDAHEKLHSRRAYTESAPVFPKGPRSESPRLQTALHGVDFAPQTSETAAPALEGALMSAKAAFDPGESFTQMLLRLIDESGRTDPDVYRHANLDRKLFSKIRSDPQYRPSRNTALALAVALRLNLDRTADLMSRAGYALSPASRFDLIVKYFIENERYNIFEINEALYAFGETQLGA